MYSAENAVDTYTKFKDRALAQDGVMRRLAKVQKSCQEPTLSILPPPPPKPESPPKHDKSEDNKDENADEDAEEPTQPPPIETKESLTFKLTLLEMYRQRVEKRAEAKAVIFERGLLNYKQVRAACQDASW